MTEDQKPSGDEPKKVKKKKSKAKKRLTAKQEAFLVALEGGKTLTDAAIAAGYSRNGAGQSGWNTLKAMREGFREASINLGLTPQTFIEKYVIPGLSATKIDRTKFMGQTTETHIDPDNAERRQSQALYARLMGALKDEKLVVDGVSNTFNIDLRQFPKEMLIAVVRLASGSADRRIPSGGGTLPQRTIDVAPGE